MRKNPQTLSIELFLYDVIYAINFNYNLISISKFSKSIPCQLIFNDTSCIILELPPLKKIEHTKASNNLYIVSQSNKYSLAFDYYVHSIVCNNTNVAHNFRLWNHRLGHPSNVVINHIDHFFSFRNNNTSFICDCCHYAK